MIKIQNENAKNLKLKISQIYVWKCKKVQIENVKSPEWIFRKAHVENVEKFKFKMSKKFGWKWLKAQNEIHFDRLGFVKYLKCIKSWSAFIQ